jgi:nucleoside-diphosphate-sugar epimerase
LRLTEEFQVANKLNVITGATGLIGSHVAELLVKRGERVRAVARRSSDTSFLEQLGVEIVYADLRKEDSLRKAVQGADLVFHCAARVGDWGTWRLFQEEVVDATRHLLRACIHSGVKRVVYTSSLTVYGRPRNGGQIT